LGLREVLKIKSYELALTKGYKAIRLGKQILRTETAPIAAMAAIYAFEKVY